MLLNFLAVTTITKEIAGEMIAKDNATTKLIHPVCVELYVRILSKMNISDWEPTCDAASLDFNLDVQPIVISSQQAVVRWAVDAWRVPREFENWNKGTNSANCSWPEVLGFDLGLSLRLRQFAGKQWYQLSNVGSQSGCKSDASLTDGSINVVVITENLVAGILSQILSMGLVTLYSGFVLLIASWVRAWTSKVVLRLNLDCMPNTKVLRQCCSDVLKARYEKDLVLEHELYQELIQIYRSSESLIHHTQVDASDARHHTDTHTRADHFATPLSPARKQE
jgi:hypothetical protein